MLVAAALCWWQPWRPATAIEGTREATFPAVDTAGLDPARMQIVEQAHAQFDARHRGAFYSQGVEEPWCADFVSWVMNAAGQPLTNPNSGSWRIPGVATLQEFYEAAGRFQPVGAYRPRVGDVVLYGEPSPFGQHTNIVLGYDDGVLTTVGGNEDRGVSVHRFPLAGDPGVLGFGTL
ncbi:CHAP domain-containing protein [Mycobacterium sp. M1]|uniref:CHAP domain-containing protein n=2 Tax=Mycolicibacter acidiphilus TaxID=2835306 RepID=A0ABS5RD42_9MYCO|nr:CHAP domain-containing protein [Mycolicibacter acidiphilus]